MTSSDAVSGTVLIVDGDHAIRTFIDVLLRRAGFQTRCIEDGEDPTALFGGGFDVIVRDVNLAPAHRELAVQELERTAPEVLRRTVVTTTSPVSLLHDLQCGTPFAVVQKPFEVDAFLRIVGRCARQARPRSRARKPRASMEDDGGGPGVDLAALQRFVRSIPNLRELVNSRTRSDEELMLCGEIRRTALELSERLGEAARHERDVIRAAVLRGSAAVADELGRVRPGHRARPTDH